MGPGISLAAAISALAIASMIALAASVRSEPGAIASIVVGAALSLVVQFALRGQARRIVRGGLCTSGSSRATPALVGTARGYLFHSSGYAVSFAEANVEKLVNIEPELRRLLQASSASRQVDPEPSRGRRIGARCL